MDESRGKKKEEGRWRERERRRAISDCRVNTGPSQTMRKRERRGGGEGGWTTKRSDERMDGWMDGWTDTLGKWTRRCLPAKDFCFATPPKRGEEFRKWITATCRGRSPAPPRRRLRWRPREAAAAAAAAAAADGAGVVS